MHQLLAEPGIRVNPVAPAGVLPASSQASDIPGARIAVTGGTPIL